MINLNEKYLQKRCIDVKSNYNLDIIKYIEGGFLWKEKLE